MLGSVTPTRLKAASLLFILSPLGARGQDGEGVSAAVIRPPTQTYHYTVEWRLVTAGTAKLTIAPTGTPQYPSLHSELLLSSTGLVSKLYKVEDKYFGNYDNNYCAVNSQMVASEGRRRREVKVNYDRTRNKADYLENDLVKNSTVHASTIDIPPCVHDVVGGLLAMRKLRIEPGKSGEMAVTDGKKSVMVRVEAQEREDVKLNNIVHKCVRYEVFLFNNVLYPRKARLFVWLTDDAERTPVQIRLRMNFPIGTVTLSLDKIEQS